MLHLDRFDRYMMRKEHADPRLNYKVYEDSNLRPPEKKVIDNMIKRIFIKIKHVKLGK